MHARLQPRVNLAPLLRKPLRCMSAAAQSALHAAFSSSALVACVTLQHARNLRNRVLMVGSRAANASSS